MGCSSGRHMSVLNYPLKTYFFLMVVFLFAVFSCPTCQFFLEDMIRHCRAHKLTVLGWLLPDFWCLGTACLEIQMLLMVLP